MTNFEDLIQDAESIVVLTVSKGRITCGFSSDLTDDEVLDLLALATTQLYNTLDSKPETKH